MWTGLASTTATSRTSSSTTCSPRSPSSTGEGGAAFPAGPSPAAPGLRPTFAAGPWRSPSVRRRLRRPPRDDELKPLVGRALRRRLRR
eukprot:9656060-Alexandrium_andersonii.AAC.1